MVLTAQDGELAAARATLQIVRNRIAEVIEQLEHGCSEGRREAVLILKNLHDFTLFGEPKP